MKPKHSGFITLACGRRHAEMALDMALSLREFHEEPVSIVVDGAAARHLRRYGALPFDQIIPVPLHVHPWGAKFLVAEFSPYRHSVYVDADILFVGRFGLIDYRQRLPLAMYGAYMGPYSDFETYFPPPQVCRDFSLRRYFWATSGAFRFLKPGALAMFEDCYEFYTHEIRKHPRYASHAVPDELVFAILADKHPVESIEPRGHPWPSAAELQKLPPHRSRWPLIHFFAPIAPDGMRQLMDDVRRRRRDRLYPLRSEAIWFAKASSIPTFWDKLRHVGRVAARKLTRSQ